VIRACVAVLASLVVSTELGCAQLVAPDVGPPLHGACTDSDHDPANDVSFAASIEPIIDEYHCRDCHSANGKTPIGLLVGGLDLGSYGGLRAGGARSGANIIVPGKPCTSVLLQKVSAGPPFGSRMPEDGPTFLDDEDLELISDWIAEGAHDN
jgi:cytochrome c